MSLSIFLYVCLYIHRLIPHLWLSKELHWVPGFPSHLLPRRLVAAAWEAPHRGCPSGRTVASGTPTKNPRRRLTDSTPQWLLLGDRLGYVIRFGSTPGQLVIIVGLYLYLPSQLLGYNLFGPHRTYSLGWKWSRTTPGSFDIPNHPNADSSKHGSLQFTSNSWMKTGW